MKKVLQISNYYYPNIGGIEQVARDIANSLNSKEGEFEQKIICFNEYADDGEYKCNRRETVHELVDGVEIIRCGCFTKIFSQSLSLTYAKELKKIMDSFNPDIIIFHYPNPFAAYNLLKYKNRKFKLLLYWHLDITKQKFLKKFFFKQNLSLIERAFKILGATPKHVNESEFTNEFGEKKYVLPYMIDEKNLILSKDEQQESNLIRAKYEEKVLALFIGRHVPYKGLQYLLKASKELEGENIHFLIAGSGELTEKLKNEAKVDHKVEFLGRISDSQRRAYLKACDIICFPSITRNEGFGLALAEGMYFSHPAVTFTIKGSGVNYVNLDGITGIECPNCDYKAYAEAIKRLLRDENLRKKYGEAARQRVLNNFSYNSFKNNLLKLMELI